MSNYGSFSVQSVQTETRQCSLPDNLLRQAGWRPGDTVVLRFGTARVHARLGVAPNGRCLVSAVLLRRLALPARRLNYQINPSERSIRFGPLIGIMTTWTMTAYFRAVMVAAARSGMMAVVFRPADVCGSRGRMQAWALTASGIRRVAVPWPDVVYNRIPNRGGEMLGSTRLCKRLLARRGIPVFNRTFFHKWRIYRLLRRDETGNSHLPESHPLTNLSQVPRMLQRYPMVYLKPNGGSKGIGIVKVNRLPGGRYSISYRKGHRNYQLTSSSWAEAQHLVRRGMNPRSYVIQEGLRLARYRGRPFDVRVTLYKDGNGKWIPSGPAAKIAGRGSITTHVHNGGYVVPLSRALNHAFGDQAELVYEKIKQASVEIAQAVERVTNLELGELGLDIGVTANGRVAMFEANSKPGRTIFSPRFARDERRRSLFYLCGYAARLAGFGVKEDGDEQQKA
ncbi:MAG: YheC/YheD family protein [Bacillota bacterium]